MSTQIILVSHALTQWNIEGKIQGHTDVPLNFRGRKMAEQLARRLSLENIDAVYTSDLTRAVQTAKPVAEQKGLRIKQDIRLREGRSINQEKSNIYPTLAFAREIETETDLCLRIKDALCDIAPSHDAQTVLVVSHGGALEIFINHVLEQENNSHLEYRGIRTALNRLVYDSGLWQCASLDENDFL